MHPKWASGELSRLYWQVRYRHGGRKCKYYRRIAEIKRQLLADGVPAIEIHLYCRILANPRLQTSRRRWESYIRDRDAGISPWLKLRARNL